VAEVETKAVSVSPELWGAFYGGVGGAKSGVSVTTESALRVPAFYRAICVIADGIRQLPCEVYRPAASGRGVEPAIEHPLYDLLLHKPNALQDAANWFGTVLMHAAATGDHVSYRNVVGGELRELIPIRPEFLQMDMRADGEIEYRVQFENGQTATLHAPQVFHVRGPSWDGWRGVNPVQIGREAIGLAQATEETHARLHGNGSRPSGVLQSEQKLDKAQLDLLREQWMQAYGGVSNTGKPAVLGAGLKWQQIAMSGVDAEHVRTRELQISEIARLLGVFPIMLGHAGDQSPTFASAEAFFAAHTRQTLQPWIKTLRSAIETQLLTKDERRAGYHIRIDTSELLRGSLESRAAYYKAALG
jgi:HK97 family phage portal protein